jgi:hypothetical protein
LAKRDDIIRDFKGIGKNGPRFHVQNLVAMELKERISRVPKRKSMAKSTASIILFGKK